MELTSWMTLGSFILAVPQAGAAIASLLNWFSNKKTPTATMPLSQRFMIIFLFAGALFAAAFGGWLLGHPIKPVTNTVYVDKPVTAPCPAASQTNGAATAPGNGSIAHSGNGDTYTAPPQPSPKH